MKSNDPSRWLPRGLEIRAERLDLGRLRPRLYRIADPGRLIDSTDAESFGEDERFPYWSEVWPSSIGLGRFLARGPSLTGFEAVELGCGTGLAGVSAALRGARVTFTDYELPALAFSRANHELNLGVPGRTRHFDWRTPPRKLTASLVLASDVLYETRFLGPFLSALRRILLPGGVALVAEPGRKIAEGSVEGLERIGYRRSLHLEEFDHGQRHHAVWIHRIFKPAERGLTWKST